MGMQIHRDLLIPTSSMHTYARLWLRHQLSGLARFGEGPRYGSGRTGIDYTSTDCAPKPVQEVPGQQVVDESDEVQEDEASNLLPYLLQTLLLLTLHHQLFAARIRQAGQYVTDLKSSSLVLGVAHQ